jgi:hypothetical protein
MPRISKTLDKLLQLKDAGAVTADAAAQVGGADKIVDLGAGLVNASVVIDITAITTNGATAENYLITIQGSNSATFSTGNVVLANKEFGHSTTLEAGATTVAGRYIVPFSNELGGTIYRYVRAYHNVEGTAPSINYSAYIAKG